ncbi:hypothetical protein [Borreliella valaisiana]|uniref:hypothetical protein n=1 Tax=Borreliella valaisiana TaxID=62088 RepID=UPI001AEDC87E|nr:hypothetical protein [Borreliella valaisiana]
MKENLNHNAVFKKDKRVKFVLDVQFFIEHFYLIVTTSVLYLLNLSMTYNGLIVYESLILYGKNLKETNNVDFYSNIVLAIFIITIPATIFSILLHLAINHMNVESKFKKFTLKVFLSFLLLWTFAAQIPSTWYSFESFFKKFYGSRIQTLKDEIQNEIAKKKDLIKKNKEDLLVYQEDLINKIKKNKLTIERIENRQLELDPFYVTMTNNLQKQIDRMEERNKALLEKLQNHKNEIGKLDNELSNFIRAKKEEIIRTQGVNVLFGNSSIIDKKDHIENLRTWFFLLVSSTLDLLIGALLTFVYYARKKYIVDHVQLKSKSSVVNKATNNAKFDIAPISNFFKSFSNFSKKIITQNKVDFNNLGKQLFDTLDFILNFLEDDQGTINSMEDICKKSGRTKYFIKKNINLLIESNLVFMKKKRYILNMTQASKLIKLVKESKDEKLKTLFDKYKFTTLLTNTI